MRKRDSSPRIADSLQCYACGYDLRGLREAEVCPECGLQINFTIEQTAIEGQLDPQAKEDERRWREQSERTDAQQDQVDQQAERCERILDRWEAIQSRIERLLDRWEQRDAL